MFKLIFTLSLAIIASNANSQIITRTNSEKIDTSTAIDFSKLKIVELPMPNSGTYSYEEAGKRKNEIYNLQPTQKYFDWKAPTLGGAVHINKKMKLRSINSR